MARDDWQTPEDLLERARKVLGRIDLDPFSSAQANQRVQAGWFYDGSRPEMDAYRMEWFGRVWWNPPYSLAKMGPAAQKMVAEYKGCRVEAAVGITNVDPSTDWFGLLMHSASAWVFPNFRVAFIDPETGLPERSNRNAQAIWYHGPDRALFAQHYGELGTVCVRYVPW